MLFCHYLWLCNIRYCVYTQYVLYIYICMCKCIWFQMFLWSIQLQYFTHALEAIWPLESWLPQGKPSRSVHSNILHEPPNGNLTKGFGSPGNLMRKKMAGWPHLDMLVRAIQTKTDVKHTPDNPGISMHILTCFENASTPQNSQGATFGRPRCNCEALVGIVTCEILEVLHGLCSHRCLDAAVHAQNDEIFLSSAHKAMQMSEHTCLCI